MNLAPMLIYIWVCCITPGPNNLMVMYLAANFGIKGSGKFMVASASSFFVKMLLCGVLNMVLAAAVPVLVPYLKWVGAAYMLYLAYTMLAKGFGSGEHGAAQDRQGESTYRSGILLQLLNVKSWVMGLSVFSIYVIPYTSAPGPILLSVLICTASMIAATMIWAACGGALKRIYDKHIKMFSLIMALSLVWCAVTAVL